jgi:hypothetical protein
MNVGAKLVVLYIIMVIFFFDCIHVLSIAKLLRKWRIRYSVFWNLM